LSIRLIVNYPSFRAFTADTRVCRMALVDRTH